MTSKANSEASTHLEEGTVTNDDNFATKDEPATENSALEDKVEIEEDPDNPEEV